MDKVVVLAAGAGTRMRKADAAAQLTAEQQALADRGHKGLIPIGRPFLDYVLTRVADAGFRQVCLVIGPRHDELRDYYAKVATSRLQLGFAVQAQPLGTAHALAAAAEFVGSDPFLMINSDNCYPVEVMRRMRAGAECAVAGFDRDGLLRGNIPADRLSKFAILESDQDGYLQNVLEKPDPDVLSRLSEPILVSMNCWRFSPAILTACGRIRPSPRGEFEIPDAVVFSMTQLGVRYRICPSVEPVLDLSSRQDVAALNEHLATQEVNL